MRAGEWLCLSLRSARGNFTRRESSLGTPTAAPGTDQLPGHRVGAASHWSSFRAAKLGLSSRSVGILGNGFFLLIFYKV